MLHKNIPIADNHPFHTYTYADAAARAAATGFVAADLGKVAWQLDNNTYWALVATTPTWMPLNAGSFSTSAQLAALLSDETGSGAAVFGIAPTMASVRDTKTAPAISTGTLTLDLASCSFFDVALNANITTLTISNPAASGTGHAFLLAFTADGTARTVSWPASVKWPGGTAPTLTSTNGKLDVFAFHTKDGGTTWYGTIVSQNS